MTTFEAIQIKNELFDDAEDLSKCGDIFICNRGNFTFSCYFCTQRFTIYEEFIGHIQESHFKLIVQDEAESEVTKIVGDAIIKEEEEYVIGLKPTVETTAVENNQKDSATTERAKDDPDSIFHSEVNSDRGKGGYKCGECNKMFVRKAGLVIHARTHKNKTKESNCDESTATGASPAKSKDCLFKCNDCEYSTDAKYKLTVHERIHTGEMPYQCETCKKCFRTRANLNFHIVIHTGEKPYKCTYCPIAFASKPNLTVHIRRVHLNQKPHKCQYCDKQFVTRSDRARHEWSHTGERPFQCEICGAKFRSSGPLYVHKRTHETIRRYACKLCDKKFKTATCLKTHNIVHSEEKPHVCEVCQAAFPRNRALRTHMKLHSDVKEYVCNICQKEFAQYAGLYSHMKSHGVKPPSKSKN